MFLKEQRPEAILSQRWTRSSLRVPEPLKGKTRFKDTRRCMESYGQHEAVDRVESFSAGSREPEQGQRVQETPVGSKPRGSSERQEGGLPPPQEGTVIN